MSRGYAALPAAIVLALGACAAQTSSSVDMAAEEQAIRAVSARWLELERSDDAAGIAALFTADGIVFREDRDPIAGQSAVQAHMVRSFQENPTEIVDWSTDHVDIAASGELATERGSWSVKNSGLSGTVEDHGSYITVYRKIDGEWKVLADMSVSTAPAAATPAQ
jgi:uncharacterized protein (TIGR02246 family)